jgi:hypothetical protein
MREKIIQEVDQFDCTNNITLFLTTLFFAHFSWFELKLLQLASYAEVPI